MSFLKKIYVLKLYVVGNIFNFVWVLKIFKEILE